MILYVIILIVGQRTTLGMGMGMNITDENMYIHIYIYIYIYILYRVYNVCRYQVNGGQTAKERAAARADELQEPINDNNNDNDIN